MTTDHPGQAAQPLTLIEAEKCRSKLVDHGHLPLTIVTVNRAGRRQKATVSPRICAEATNKKADLAKLIKAKNADQRPFDLGRLQQMSWLDPIRVHQRRSASQYLGF